VCAVQVIDDTGNVLDANYSIEPGGTRLAVIMDGRSGRSRTTGKETNRDDNIALQRLLETARWPGRDVGRRLRRFGHDKEARLGIPEAERRIVDRAKLVPASRRG
jgi:hypothetical protein